MVRIPRRLDEILPTMAMEKLLDVLQQPDISGKVREALHKVGLQDAAPLDRVKEAWQQARNWLDSFAENVSGSQQPTQVLNASGELISNSLIGVPIAPAVAYRFAQLASNYQSAAAAMSVADGIASRLFAGQAVAWLHSTSDALRLLASGGQGRAGVFISRIDAVRIAGLGDIHAMLAAGRQPLHEIGAANSVTAEDWRVALNQADQKLVLTSPNNLPLSKASQHRGDAIAAARAAGAKVIEVLADGVVSPILSDQCGFPEVRSSLAEGADVIVLPLNLLIGGAAGALLVGDPALVLAARQLAKAAGVLLEGALLNSAALAIELASRNQEADLGVAAQLLVNPENLKNRARRLAVQLSGVGEVADATEVELREPLGDSPWDRYQIASWGVRLRPKTSLEELTRHIQRGEQLHACELRLVRQADALLLNLRLIPAGQDQMLVQIVGDHQGASAEPPEDGHKSPSHTS